MPTDQQLAWFQDLRQYETRDVQRAIVKVLEAPIFGKFPQIGEITDLIKKKGGAVSVEFRARLAWGCACRAVRVCGVYRIPQFHDPLIRETLRAMGLSWAQFVELDSKDRGWQERRFSEIFIGLAGLTDHVEPLVNLLDREPARERAAIGSSQPGLGDGGIVQRLISKVSEGMGIEDE